MSQASAKTALGATLWAVADGGSLAKIAEVLRIDPPKATRGMIEASDLETTGGKEYIPEGLYDAGEVSGLIHWIMGSTVDDLLIAGITGGGLYDFKIVGKAASGTEDFTFSGFFTEVGGEPLEVGGKQTFTFTAKITGDWAQAATGG